MRTVASLAMSLLVAGSLSAQARSYAPATDFGAAVAIRNGIVMVGRGGGALGSTYPSKGGVHLFERASGAWRSSGDFSAADVKVGDRFGSAIVTAGPLVLVGAPGRNEGRGAAYVFSAAGSGWREVAQLDPGADPGAAAGASLAFSGDVAVLGAPGAKGPGAVFVFRRSGNAWALETRLTGGGGTDGFGTSIALAGGWLIVGAPADSSGRGAVHVYRQEGANWLRNAVLHDANGRRGDRLGQSVEGMPNSLAAGAPGAAGSRGQVVVFRRQGDRWVQGTTIASPDTTRGNRFGTDVAVDGGKLWIGAPGTDQGRGAVWHTDAGSPADAMERVATGPLAVGDRFGGRLAVEGSVAAIVATAAAARTGAVLLFEQSGGAWRQAHKLFEPPPMTFTAMTGDEVRCTDGKVDQFECADVDLVAFLPLAAIGGTEGVIANDIWGWTDPETNREYALVGRSDATAFVDITDPGHPRYLGDLPLHQGANVNLWRDIKVYKDHAFIVADGAGNHGVQIFDLTELRRATGDTPVHFRETAHYDKIASAHNIVINEQTGYAFSVGSSGGGETCGGGLHMIDIRNPREPTFAGCFSHAKTGRTGTGYSHDAQCVVYHGPDDQYRGREICMGANETALSIADITDKSSPVAISSAAYPNVAYAHQGWLSDDHRFFYMGDEADEVAGEGASTRTLVWDVSDLDDPVLVTEYRASTHAIDHNQYVKGNYLYQSNLLAGLRIIDVSDPKNPREVGFFDTVPWDGDQTGFGGTWSNYPYFSSGVIAVSSWNEGLFLLKRRERPVP